MIKIYDFIRNVMKITPKYLIFVSSITVLLSSTAHAARILPTQANENAQLNAGIRNTADFDWTVTNLLNNGDYFKDKSNFFDSDVRHKITYNASENAFLNAKKLLIDRHNKGGKSLKQFSVFNSGHDSYNTFATPKTYNLGNDDTVTGMGGTTGNGSEKFEIFGGTTGQAMNVSMAFRSKSVKESYGYQTPPGSGSDHYTNDKLIGHSPIVGNVMRLHGMGIQAATADGRVKTNPFALEATYTDADFEATFSLSELEELLNGCLFLGWLNTSLDGDPNVVTDGDRWVHAVQGNYDNMPDNPNRHDFYKAIGNPLAMSLQDYIDGTVTSIEGLSKASGEIRVGDHGGWAADNTVWAVVDHNSDFAVIPEPSTYALIGGVICLATVVLRRRK